MVRRVPLIAAVMMSGMVSLQAASIAIDNHSFESSGLAGDTWTNTYPDWEEAVPDSNGSFVETITDFAAEGTHHLGINSIPLSIASGILPPGSTTYSVWLDLGFPVMAETEYTLTVAIGNRSPIFTLPGNRSVFELALSTGSVLSQGIFDASTIPPSTFIDQSISFRTGMTPPEGNLLIRLTNDDPTGIGSRSHFDNVRLETAPARSSVPDGGTTLPLLSMALLGTLALKRLGRFAR